MMSAGIYESHPVLRQLWNHFVFLYGESQANLCLQRALMLADRYGPIRRFRPESDESSSRWSERSRILIVYPDHLIAAGQTPLSTLREFIEQRLQVALDTIHILPFFPSSSDEGFSVIHYRQVDPRFGAWEDISAFSKKFRLVFDLVLNHVSRKSGWFRDFEMEIAPGRAFFILQVPQGDYSQVVRPRATPLFTPVKLKDGRQVNVWTTFSEDQVDLNYANPDTLFELLDIALFYAAQGADILRLDAVAYLWKKPGSRCIHLPETHAVIKVIRGLLALAGQSTMLLTETNVPHQENISYFGTGDEAHLVYQFSLPPLVLYSLLKSDASVLTEWVAQCDPPPPGCTWINFTASHDGIGVWPLEDCAPAGAINWLVEETRRRHGLVSVRRREDGTVVPYELNITFFDALSDPEDYGNDLHIRRFIASQAIPMMLRGVPAVYFSSLLAAPNDHERVGRTGYARAINRTRWELPQMERMLNSERFAAARVFPAMLHMLKVRGEQAAFHPDAPQRVLRFDPGVFAVERISRDSSSSILALVNVSAHTIALSVDRLRAESVTAVSGTDLLSDERLNFDNGLALSPYAVRWIRLNR